MPAQPSADFLTLISQVIKNNVPPTLTITATSAAASPNLTALGSATGLMIGAVVVTPVAAVGKTVVAVDNAAHTATLSGNAGITGTEAFTFSPPTNALAMQVGLFTGTPTLSTSTVYADLAQPTYTGYALQDATVGTARGDAAGDIILPLGTSTWQPTAAVSPEQTITGFFVVEKTTNVLLFSEYLPTPFIVTGPLDAMDVIDEVYFPADTVFGGICTTCMP